ALLERVGLDGYGDKYPHMLSGGEQQRVALARALAPQPTVILLDEPLSDIDTRLRDTVRDETVRVLKDTNTTAIIVTHDPQEALRIADRIALLRHGRLVQTGTPETLYWTPTDLQAARFFSVINTAPGTVSCGIAHTPVGNFPAARFDDGAKVNVCFRPHSVAISKLAPLGVDGRILRRVFLGDADQLEIEVPGLGAPLHAQVQTAFMPNISSVSVSVDRNQVVVFPA
ncbi:MAG: ABC transporter ATP-binding protein, partial [Pseudomonadota bacterium]